ncbi:MAG: hypothetical protein R2939_03150 [Kofleriaceae bacterium]
MRIDPTLVDPIRSRPRGTDSCAEPDEAATPSVAAVVVLSDAAASTQRPTTEHAIAARLEQISALLHRGEYPIDLDRLADRLLADDAARLGRPELHAAPPPGDEP